MACMKIKPLNVTYSSPNPISLCSFCFTTIPRKSILPTLLIKFHHIWLLRILLVNTSHHILHHICLFEPFCLSSSSYSTMCQWKRKIITLPSPNSLANIPKSELTSILISIGIPMLLQIILYCLDDLDHIQLEIA